MTTTMNTMNPMDNEVNIEAIEDMADALIAETEYAEYQLRQQYNDMLVPVDDHNFGLEDLYYTPEDLDAMEARRKADLEADLDDEINALWAKLDADLEMLFGCCAVCAACT